MPDQEFKILITGDAGSFVGAAQKTSDAANKIKVDVSDLSDATKRKLNLDVEAVPALDKHGKKLDEVAEKSEKGGREMRRLANEVGNMVGVSDLGALTMGKMGAAVFGVSLALDLLRESYRAVQEGNNGAISIEVHDNSAAISNMTKAWDEFAIARKKAIDAANTPEAQAGREQKDLENKLKLLHEILKVEEAEALVALAANQDKMTPQAYAQAQNRIKKAFEDKNVSADETSRYEQIKVQEREAKHLEVDAAAKKAKGESMTGENASDAQGAAKKNAAKGAAALDGIEEQIEREKRFRKWATGHAGDVPEYEGVGGKLKEASDLAGRYANFGARDTGEVMKDLELQRTQAQAAIAQGERATKQGETGKALITEAGAESVKAANLRAEIKAALAEFSAENNATAGNQAVAQAATAIGQEHAADGNNTPAGTRDALAALAAGTNAAAAVQAQLKAVGNSNKELHDSLFKALEDVAAENRRLARLIRSMPTINK